MAVKRHKGLKMTEEHRLKIQNSNVLNALVEHAEGRREMSSTQVQAAIALVKKYLPDVSSVTVSGDADNPIPLSISVKYEAPK